MTGNADVVDVVHACTAKGAIGHGKSARLYNVRVDPQPAAQTHNLPVILGDVGLVKRDPNGGPGTPRRSVRSRCRQMIYATNPRGGGSGAALFPQRVHYTPTQI